MPENRRRRAGAARVPATLPEYFGFHGNWIPEKTAT